MKPLNNLCIVKPINQVKEKESETGILLPEYSDNIMPNRGKVISIGSKVTEVKVGQTILFDRIRVSNDVDRGAFFIEKGEKFLFVREELIKLILD